MPDFQIVVDQATAEAEVQRLLDRKKVFPKQRERLAPAIEQVVEAMTYGLVTINDDGSITQKLLEPINGIEEIKYASRIEPITINRRIQNLKVDNVTNRFLVYLSTYSNQMETIFLNMEPSDRSTADSIAFFFQ